MKSRSHATPLSTQGLVREIAKGVGMAKWCKEVLNLAKGARVFIKGSVTAPPPLKFHSLKIAKMPFHGIEDDCYQVFLKVLLEIQSSTHRL